MFGRRSTLRAAIFTVLQTPAPAAAGRGKQAYNRLGKISVEATEDSVKTDVAPRLNIPQQLLDTPQTIQVIPQTVIRDRAATTLRDVLRNSPGITFQAGEGGGGLPGDQNFSMRGSSARNSLFIDGVRDVGSYTRDSFNLQQVEVIKGPTGTMAGRSAHHRRNQSGHQDSASGTTRRTTRSATAATISNGSAATSISVWATAWRSALNAMYQATPKSRIATWWRTSAGASRLRSRLGSGAPPRAFTASALYVEEDNVPDYGLPWARRRRVA